VILADGKGLAAAGARKLTHEKGSVPFELAVTLRSGLPAAIQFRSLTPGCALSVRSSRRRNRSQGKRPSPGKAVSVSKSA